MKVPPTPLPQGPTPGALRALTLRAPTLKLPTLCVLAIGALALTASRAAPLPYQSPDKHLGVASCASSVCHGSVEAATKSHVQLNEYVTWSHQDRHAQAYQVLLSAQGRSIGAKLGLTAPETAKLCLDCHADNVLAAQRGPTFTLNDGVGCEACHGGGERWIASHSKPGSNYRQDVKDGLYPSADLSERTTLCLSCHQGTADKFATHRIMGAGHPRLSFELNTFLALEPPHWRSDETYRARKPVYRNSQAWARAQVLAAEAQLRLTEAQFTHSSGAFPELALFNCSSCHDSSMHHLEWRSRAFTQGTGTGTVSLNDASLRMAWIVARSINSRDAGALLTQAQALQNAAATNREQLHGACEQLIATLERLRAALEHDPASPAPKPLLENVLQAGIDGEFRDYLGAEQGLMAIDLLLIETSRATSHKQQIDELYTQLQSDEGYRPSNFTASLKALRASL